jgi:meso-butanediol dehydrogenase/(S,S)-butanediol dehydrogenase/diacetyl reductase
MSDRKTALVTGAAGGIGRATCERLVAAGWNVFGTDVDAESLRWAEDDERIRTAVADVGVEADNQRIVAAADAAFGRLDTIVLNAGMNGIGRIDELDMEYFQRVVAVNMMGPVFGVRAALPLLRRQPGSSIVVTSSIMGIRGDDLCTPYAMTKHAVIGLVRSLARELGPEGIRANAICPGVTRTTMTGVTQLVDGEPPAYYERLRACVPLLRWAEADEMASVIEFLVSPAASYVNGHVMVADGGVTAGTGLRQPGTELYSG